MSTNRERTPTKRDFELAWDYYRAHQDYAMERDQKYHDYRLEFMRGWNEINTAAEQRALREAAESNRLIDHMYKHFDNHPIQAPAAVRATATYLHNRADQEGDND